MLVNIKVTNNNNSMRAYIQVTNNNNKMLEYMKITTVNTIQKLIIIVRQGTYTMCRKWITGFRSI